MSSLSVRTKSVSLTFRGFDLTAEEVVALVGVAASRLGNRGEPVKPGVKTRLTRSYAIFSLDFLNDYELCEMLPALLTHLGGINHLFQIQSQIQPEFSEIHFDLPVAASDESQEGYLSTTVIADVSQLKASISFGFF
ncbi:MULTISPECIES: hypothetical protein [Pseudomonas]|uniref:Uncharacterized protein n=1 Tax=Pseudomonas cichorii TaxID=36746 RepID=A0ABQ1DLS5_PSECI|nr:MULTISPECIES: hypothetical protein [Pseudomonas]QVE16517.1 hypothetical protein KGD89_22040 [Pseudomonas cichorii]GFM91948.1 hypothetical protein PSCICP_19200 [Pseudomonas cichorii]